MANVKKTEEKNDQENENDEDNNRFLLQLFYNKYSDTEKKLEHLQLRIAAWSTLMIALCAALSYYTNIDRFSTGGWLNYLYTSSTILAWIFLVLSFIFVARAELTKDVKDVASIKEWNDYKNKKGSRTSNFFLEMRIQFAYGENNKFNLYQKRMTLFYVAQKCFFVSLFFLLMTYFLSIIIVDPENWTDES